MSEIIVRRHGQAQDKTPIGGGRPQVSFNSDDRLTVRFIQGSSEDDTLIVFDAETSQQIIDFCQTKLRSREEKGHANNIPF